MMNIEQLSSNLTIVANVFKSEPGALNISMSSKNDLTAQVTLNLFNKIEAEVILVKRKYDNGKMPYELQKKVFGVTWFTILDVVESIKYMNENGIPIPEALKGAG